MDQQQKRPREDAAPASPKRLKHSVPVHIFYLGIYWYLDNTRCARDRIVDWLRNHTNYDDVTVDLLVPAKGEGQPKGTAWFHGYGDAPFAAARRAVGAGPATDPHAARAKNNLMFQEVKEHNGFAASEERRLPAGQRVILGSIESLTPRRRRLWGRVFGSSDASVAAASTSGDGTAR